MNKRLFETIKHIKKNSKTQPIIIVQGDQCKVIMVGERHQKKTIIAHQSSGNIALAY